MPVRVRTRSAPPAEPEAVTAQERLEAKRALVTLHVEKFLRHPGEGQYQSLAYAMDQYQAQFRLAHPEKRRG